MATPKTPAQLAEEATTLATSFEYVYHAGVLYAPAHYETGDMTVIPPDEAKCWIPQTPKVLQRTARAQFDTLFKQERELYAFLYMVQQESIPVDVRASKLLIKTTQGLRVLNEDGTLSEPDGTFIPNTIHWMLNEDEDDIAEVMSVITEWVGGDEEIALSLLRHLATSLAPHWSAGKYILLIGDGRNGKSVLGTMLEDLFGSNNCSKVKRQVIAKESPAVCDLNGKLLNLVMDGSAKFIEDSGTEKSLITGEAVGIRRLWDQGLTDVQTNALFMEGLNQEPKSRDKSSALQARMVRFIFPNTYAIDPVFFDHMRSERMLGAFLSLLIQNYVQRKDLAVMLAPTEAAITAQLEHMIANSLALQFMVELETTQPLGAEDTLVGMEVDELTQRFASWRLKQNDVLPWEGPAVLQLFSPLITTDRRSARASGKRNPGKVRYVTGLKKDALAVLAMMKEEEADATTDVVGD